MRAFLCPDCRALLEFEDRSCAACGAPVGVHLPSLSMVRAPAGPVEVAGRTFRRCANWDWGCNWLVRDDVPSAQCFAGSVIRRRPDNDDTVALEKLATTAFDLRRLLFQLFELGLPVTPYWLREGGLAFDLLSSQSTGEPVTIGHANGVITIDLLESLDAHRESLRVRLGEPYRTMLGHFRHEVGHYYEWVLVEQTPLIDEAREIFGDERASYADAIDRHYTYGPPADWRDSFLSEYATMHPWEDFAECFAHYLHITDTIDTAREAGLALRAARTRGFLPSDVDPRDTYDDATIDELLTDWTWCANLFNRVNNSMGKSDLYPFALPPPVVAKLGFIHRVVRDAVRARHGRGTDPEMLAAAEALALGLPLG